MTTGAHRRCGYVAAAVLAIGAAAAPRLVAQGSAQATTGVESALAEPAERPRLVPARGMLRHLVGTWRFEIRFAGNFDGPPDAAGTRVVRALFDDLRVEWTEELDDSSIRGQGVIGFDPRSSQFFSTAVYSGAPGAELMTGILEAAEPLITFRPVALAPGTSPDQRLRQSSALTMLDRDHFTWVALDRGWRAVFTRQE